MLLSKEKYIRAVTCRSLNAARCKVELQSFWRRHVELSMSKKMFRHVLGGAANAADAADAVNAALCTLTVENLLSTVMSNMSKVALEVTVEINFSTVKVQSDSL